MALKKKPARSGSASAQKTVKAEQTVEQRLDAKAAEADTKVFLTRSLGQMTREERRKLLFG